MSASPAWPPKQGGDTRNMNAHDAAAWMLRPNKSPLTTGQKARRRLPKPRIRERILTAFLANPTAWVLLGLLLLAEYGNYQNGSAVTLLCSVIEPEDMGASSPITPLQKAQRLCAEREMDRQDAEDRAANREYP
jgi:hypothetical protein